MPYVEVNMATGRTDETKEKIIQGVTEVIVRECNVGKDHVVVLIKEFPRTNWGVSGVPLSKS